MSIKCIRSHYSCKVTARHDKWPKSEDVREIERGQPNVQSFDLLQISLNISLIRKRFIGWKESYNLGNGTRVLDFQGGPVRRQAPGGGTRLIKFNLLIA